MVPQFYNDFSDHLVTLRDACKEWAYSRRQDVNDIVEHLELLSLEASQQLSPVTTATDDIPPPTLSPPGSSTGTATSSPPASPSTSRSSAKKEKLTPRSNSTAIITDLPHPGSSQWEPLVPLPGPSASPVVRTGSGGKSKRQSRDESSPTPHKAAQGAGSGTGSGAGLTKMGKPKRQVY